MIICAARSPSTPPRCRCSPWRQGRYISQYDEEHARNVVVIGNAIADSLFPHDRPARQNGAAERPALRSDRRVREGSRAVRRLRRRPVRLHSALQFPQELSRDPRRLAHLHGARRRRPRRRARPGGGSDAPPPPCAAQRRERFRGRRPEFLHRPVEPAHRAPWRCSPASSAPSACWWAASG